MKVENLEEAHRLQDKLQHIDFLLQNISDINVIENATINGNYFEFSLIESARRIALTQILKSNMWAELSLEKEEILAKIEDLD